MKRINYIPGLLMIISLSLLAGGCSKDFTSQQPANQSQPGSALSTEGGLQIALNGMYAGLRSSNLWGRSIPIIGDLMGDNIFIAPNNSGRYILQYTYSVIPSDIFVTGLWNDAYTAILRCNNIIDATVSANANVNEYRGEAMATRALLYFYLVNLYGKPYADDPSSLGVPLVLHYAPAAQPARNSVAEIYKQIVTDLSTATDLMTEYTNSSQFSLYAAEALLAKVYIYMGDYADAKTAALNVINNSGFTLVPGSGLAAYWASPEIRTDKVETLFEVSSDKVNNAGTDALDFIYDQNVGYGDMLCSHDLYYLYTTTDYRTSWLQVGSRNGVSSVFVNKFPNAGNPANKDKTKVLRLSDVYLLAAEACQRTGDIPLALTYLNAISRSRDPGFSGYTDSGDALLADIIRERRKELAFEGDRFLDLNRLKYPISRSTDYQPATARNIPYGDTRRVAPIPLTQTQTDPNIKQNQGYQ